MLDTAEIAKQLADFREGLVADGYDLVVDKYVDGTAHLRITAGTEACAECLVPKPLMTRMISESLKALPEVRKIDLTYPAQ